jgi:hypothetical protein
MVNGLHIRIRNRKMKTALASSGAGRELRGREMVEVI